MSSLFQETIRPFVRKQLKVREAIISQGNEGESRFITSTVDLSSEGGNAKTKLPAVTPEDGVPTVVPITPDLAPVLFTIPLMLDPHYALFWSI